jgi:uncharacterized C2H2 Zn-finger protein
MTQSICTCKKCGKTFDDLGAAMRHFTKAHGMTRQQAQNERKLHLRKR